MEISNRPLISVIVPVYNVETYLTRCVDSILAQSHKNLEVILIDDGSTDASGSICDKYTEKDMRVRVIHQENSGVSVARNTGIDTADGEWFGFVDSDDRIDPQMYEMLLQAATVNNTLVSFCGSVIHNNDAEKTESHCVFPCLPLTISQKQYFEHGILDISFAASACCMLFNHVVFKEDNVIRFNATKHHWEDYLLVAQCLKKVECFAYTPQAMYHYYKREGSATDSPLNQKTLNDTSDVYSSIIAMFKPTSKYIARLVRIQYVILTSEWLWMTYKAALDEPELRYRLRRDVYHNTCSYLFSGKVSVKSKIRYLIILLCPGLAKNVWTMLKKRR